MACKRKLWSQTAMEEAVKTVIDEGSGLRQVARAYNMPVETLRRRVNGTVEVDCTEAWTRNKDMVYDYLVQMSEMGYGLSRETVMSIAYKVAGKLKKQHPFTGESAGCSLLDGFRHRHPNITICPPLPLSYNRAVSANIDSVNDFFGKIGGIYGRLNSISKPTCVFNADESGVSIVHCPSDKAFNNRKSQKLS
uniref:HTH psq-type domain-containing protein n=1 Tax=Amphimedon queenslandica TaxID=400682 RepID=A0A1X7TY21_AMPQE